MKPLIRFSLLSHIHGQLNPKLKAQAYPQDGGFLDASTNSPGLSRKSPNWPHSPTWALPYSWGQGFSRFKSWVLDLVSFSANWPSAGTSKILLRSCQGPIESRDQPGVRNLLPAYTDQMVMTYLNLQSRPAPSVLSRLTHWSEPPCAPIGLPSCTLYAEPFAAESLDTVCTGLNTAQPPPQNPCPPRTHECTLTRK